tara:strand:+ start:9 stop:821 length:813 start_codon:yes stop_codon:yes gene_type:complete
MSIKFGCIQGRLSKIPNNKYLQYFPKNWEHEINLLKKTNLDFLEFFKDRKKNSRSPFFSDKGFNYVRKATLKNNISNYSFCDDFFINRNILNYSNLGEYFKNLSKNLNKINIKIYVLALLEKSNLTNSNYLKFIRPLKIVRRILKKKGIKLALETNLDSQTILRLFKKIDNTFLVYDTGNRFNKNKDQYTEIIELKKFIIHLHLKDKNLKNQNVILGSGKVDFKKVFKALKKINYKKNFTFETNRGRNPVKTMKKNLLIIKNIARKEKFL